MALEEINARLNYLHTYTVPANAVEINARLNYLHTVSAANAVEINARLNYLHTYTVSVHGFYGSPADAASDLPNSGNTSPFSSNRDAQLGLK